MPRVRDIDTGNLELKYYFGDALAVGEAFAAGDAFGDGDGLAAAAGAVTGVPW